MIKIAVEQPFEDVKNQLNKKGYQAEMLERKVDAPDYQVVVVRDLEDLTDIHMNVPIVSARGRSVKEIVAEVEERLQRVGVIDQTSGGGSGKQFVNGLALGSIVGATIGFMLAPSSGKQTRDNLNQKIKQTKEQTMNMTNKVKEKVPGQGSNSQNGNKNELIAQERDLELVGGTEVKNK
ncbi:YkuS family protein [Sediminibacillus albus]|uniref:Uncharacterized protein family (UPF0180) n=1 Tax=Sediminibacillus albus TaxID=407036 RepID=A0A1G8WVT4_9BACI|nr:YkuS family protein [Sediminibacillus albus]SDJ82176.1 Uncharacterised protein family (UPF0180) [Sediminibacillus albus]